MNVLKVFFDTNHFNPEESGLNSFLEEFAIIEVKGFLCELEKYKGVNKDLSKMIKGKLSLHKFMKNFKKKIKITQWLECTPTVLNFCKSNSVVVYPFGGEGNEKEYLLNLEELAEQDLPEGLYLMSIGAKHKEFFYNKIKNLLEEQFDIIKEYKPGLTPLITT